MATRALAIAAACAFFPGGVAAAGGSPASVSASASQVYEEYCITCHTMKFPLQKPRSCDEWKRTVARMSAHRDHLKRGAIPEDSQVLIAQYLADQPVGP